MYAQIKKPEKNKSKKTAANSVAQNKSNSQQGFVDNRPEAVAQRKLQDMSDKKSLQQQSIQKKKAKIGLSDDSTPAVENPSRNPCPIQLAKCKEEELPCSSVTYSKIDWQGYELPKRMIARSLNRKQVKKSESQIETHSNLWDKLKSENFGNAVYYDGHVLNHKLGGAGKPPNLAPINNDANHQMSHFDGFVIDYISRINEQNESEVVDLEVAVNYGRSNGETTAENAIPQSLDMRMIPQKKMASEWQDDQIPPLVQNVKVDLAPKSSYKKVEKERKENEGSRNFMMNFLQIQKPKIETLDPLANDLETPVIPEKNELGRQQEFVDFTTTEAWKYRGRYQGEGDIVSGNIQDKRWTKFQKPFNVTAEVLLDDEVTGGIGYMVNVTVKYEGSLLLSLQANRPWSDDEITQKNLQALISSVPQLKNANLTEFEIDDP